MIRYFSSVAPLVLATLLTPATGLAADSPIAFHDVTVIEVDSGTLIPHQTVIIQGNRIQQVAALDDADLPEDTRVIQAGGHYLMPGLAEMHAHVPPVDDAGLDDVLRLYLAHGVTTIRGMLGEPGHLNLREALAQRGQIGERIGPRLLTSGPSLNGRSVRSPEQAVEMVQRQAEAGYDFLKLHPGLAADEFQAISETAKRLKLPFAGHVSADVGLDAALAAGQATIDHLDGYVQELVPADAPSHGQAPEFFGINLAADLDPAGIDDLTRRTAEAGVWNVPTQALLEHVLGDTPVATLMARPGMAYISPATRETWRQRVVDSRQAVPAADRQKLLQVRRDLIRALQQAGAGILLGSDAPQIMNVPGIAAHEELAFYVAAGLTPAQALATGTRQVAAFLDEPDAGHIAAGARADLILLDADPLQDISASRSIQGVMRDGRWYDRDTLDGWLAAIRERHAK